MKRHCLEGEEGNTRGKPIGGAGQNMRKSHFRGENPNMRGSFLKEDRSMRLRHLGEESPGIKMLRLAEKGRNTENTKRRRHLLGRRSLEEKGMPKR